MRLPTRLPRAAAALAALLLAACDDSGGEPLDPGSGDPPALTLREVARGLDQPVFLTAPVGDPRLFVVEQSGRIRIVRDGALLPTPFLDLTDRVGSGGERGLLSIAFHPDFPADPRVFVDYTDPGGDTRIESFRVGPDPDRADPSTARLILAVEQPFANHNGGQIAFGADGMLYVGMGDGGGAGDPLGHGQNRLTLLGAMLRIDVDSGDPYAIPDDNPFAHRDDARGEIWATGLRNPWRFSFDRETERLFLSDVGQNEWEEVNVVAADRGGLNFGWNRMEADVCYPSGVPCDRTGLHLPELQYPHSEGCSVTGGYVYRGSAIPALRGAYLFSDFCAGWIRAARFGEDGRVETRELDLPDVGNVSSFGQDAAGELYVLSLGGSVYRLEAR